MNSTNQRDKDRDRLAKLWYDSLPANEKRRVDEWTHRIYLAQKSNPQSKFSDRMALETAFALVIFAVNEPRCERC